MIQVNGRTLVIPRSERQIGTTYDANAEVRQFSIQRDAYGVDLSHLTYHLDLEYPGGKRMPDSYLLEKTVSEEEIILTWQIEKEAVAEAGTVWVSIRALDGNNTIRWGSNKGAFYVEDNVNAPGQLPEDMPGLEQMEILVEKSIKMSEAVKEVAEQAVKRADQATEAANGAVIRAEEVLGAAEDKVGEAADHAALSEAWAHGREDYPESAMDNSKYWCQISAGEAEKARLEADRAQMYSGIITPKFYFDLEQAELYVQNDTNIEFLINDGALFWKIEGSIFARRGNSSMEASDIQALDRSGLVVDPGNITDIQSLIDVIADRVTTKLIKKEERGVAGGIAELDREGLLKENQMPKVELPEFEVRNGNLIAIYKK